MGWVALLPSSWSVDLVNERNESARAGDRQPKQDSSGRGWLCDQRSMPPYY